jgi:hypothetical protein
LDIIVPRGSDTYGTPDHDTLSVVTTPPDPTYAEWRARCLLALALLNHRADPVLSEGNVEVVRGALLGEWDAA